MIQRIQSVYLLLTTIISGLFLSGTILKFIGTEGSDIIMKFNGIYHTSGENGTGIIEKTLPLAIVSVLIPAISLLTIFLFKNRKLQIKSAIFLIILEVLLIGAIAYYTLTVIQNYCLSPIPVFKTFIPVITIILSFLAYRGIRKDDEIVKSYDRLR
jgi:hypothetical protein